MERDMRVACAQVNVTVGDLDHNVELMLAATSRADAMECDVIVFPELAICGYPPEDLLLKGGFIADVSDALDAYARGATGLVSVVGTARSIDGRLRNSAAVCSGGDVAGYYDKRCLPNYGVFDEKRYFTRGSSDGPLFEIGGVTVGIVICEDLWADDGPYLAQAQSGIDLQICLNGSPYHRHKWQLRRQILVERAVQSDTPIAYVNLVGGQDELVFDGGSLVVDRWGSIISSAPQFDECLIYCDVDVDRADPDDVMSARLDVIEVGECRRRDERPEIPGPVSITTGSRPPPLFHGAVEPYGTCDEVYAALVLGVRDYLGKNGFGSTVIGLSGGIDSSLTAMVGVDAIGASNVTGIAMPSQYSSAHSLTDASQVATNLGISYHVIEIRPAFDEMLRTVAPLFGDAEPNVAEENIQARLRGMILMAFSNKFGSILLTTGNKSEMATGYATLYGDMAGGFAVLKDVPKTLVYELCERRNALSDADLIPRSVIEKPPSAELRPDQFDTDTLPPYPVLDAIIEAFVEDDMVGREIVAAGIADTQTVADVIGLIEASEYKRRQAPPGVRITPKAFGRDRRLPLTNRYRPSSS